MHVFLQQGQKKRRKKRKTNEQVIKGDPLTFLYHVPILAYNSVMKAYSSDQVI